MYFELSDLFGLAIALTVLWYWWVSLKVREVALKAVKKRCEALDIQLLDSSIGLRSIGLKRDDQGQVRLRRRFVFEFSSTGDNRYQGSVATLGHKVLSVEMEPHVYN